MHLFNVHKFKSMCRYVIFFLFFGLLSQQLQAQKLNRTERKIVEKVKSLDQESIAFLEKVVNMNSGTLNLDGVEAVGAVFGSAFEQIGFNTEWIDMPAAMNRAGHLFASIDGNKEKKLLLIGHLDTVFEENSPFQNFERINDSIAYGPGANDMKGGDVIVLYALKALAELNLLKNATITVAFTGDEESTGKPLSISRKALIDAGKAADIALGLELLPVLKILRLLVEVPRVGGLKLRENALILREYLTNVWGQEPFWK